MARAGRAGTRPVLTVAEGGLDANWLVRQGLPAVTFGVGQRNVHSLKEEVDIHEYLQACRMAVTLAVD